MVTTAGGMASKGLQATFLSTVIKVEAGHKPSHNNEALIGYAACS